MHSARCCARPARAPLACHFSPASRLRGTGRHTTPTTARVQRRGRERGGEGGLRRGQRHCIPVWGPPSVGKGVQRLADASGVRSCPLTRAAPCIAQLLMKYVNRKRRHRTRTVISRGQTWRGRIPSCRSGKTRQDRWHGVRHRSSPPPALGSASARKRRGLLGLPAARDDWRATDRANVWTSRRWAYRAWPMASRSCAVLA